MLGPVVADEELGGAAAWGLILAAQSAGFIVGGVFTLRFRPDRILLAATLAIFPMALPILLLAAPAPGVVTMQQQIPAEQLSRVYSYDALGSFVFIPLGAAVARPVGPAEALQRNTMDSAVEDAMFFDGPEAFEAWLETHGESAPEVWVKMAKKHTGIASLDWAAAVEVVLCFGWIDGQSRRIDADWYLQRFTPRRPQSTWSKINREKVETLTAAGRMRPAGLAEVERAKVDGRWDAAYDSPATAAVPEDLARALDAAGLSDEFAGLDSRNRYAVLHRVQTARKPETRARRIEKYVNMLAAGERPYP